MLPELDTIKLRRMALDLSQRKLAELSGVSQGTIAKIEARKVMPGYIIAKNIFDVLEKVGMREEKKARDMMSPVVAVSSEDSIGKIMSLMVKKGFSQLPVVNDMKLVGRINEKLLLDVENREEVCSSIMGPSFVTVSGEASYNLVKEILKLEDAVIVVEGDKLVGIVTKTDLLRQ